MSDLLSVIIPSRHEKYLPGTIDDILKNATGEVEVVVVYDGERKGVEPIAEKDRVKVIQSKNIGMRGCINLGVSKSRGAWIMKTDEHCRFDKGFDEKLKADCEDNWVVAPARYQVNGSFEIHSGPLSCMRFTPYLGFSPDRTGARRRQNILIDDVLGFQGSCYFMSKKHWNWLGGLDDERYGSFHFEPQEICFKTWLGGGRVVVNKKTWYKHLYRRARPSVYGYNNKEYNKFLGRKGQLYRDLLNYWLKNQWEARIHDFEWLIFEKFPQPKSITDEIYEQIK